MLVFIEGMVSERLSEDDFEAEDTLRLVRAVCSVMTLETFILRMDFIFLGYSQ